MKFRRETATYVADLPHRYVDAQGAGRCEVCTSSSTDERHTMYDQREAAAIERARAQNFPRETGS